MPSPAPLTKRGPWLFDEHGRTVQLRGVNLASRAKRPPFLPVYPASLQVPAADRAVLEAEWARVRPRLEALVRELGLNVVRLLVTWKGVEPTRAPIPGHLTDHGRAYLDHVAWLAVELRRLGVWSFVDFHQDLAHELYGGEGFPDWALAVDAEHPRPERPPVLGDGWGLNYYQLLFRSLAPMGPLVRHTLRSFWNNRLTNETLTNYRVRDHFLDTFRAAVAHLDAQPGVREAVIGFEPFNEPHQVGLDDTQFEREVLGPFYREALRAVRDAGSGALLFAEPRVDWTVYPLGGPEFQYFEHTDDPTTALKLDDADDEGFVFSFHYYDPRLLELASSGLRWLDPFLGDETRRRAEAWPHAFDRMHAAATARKLVPFLSEFGASHGWEPPDFVTHLDPASFAGSRAAAALGRQLAQVERLHLHATAWNVDLYNTREDGDGWNGEDFSLLGPRWELRHAPVLARPFARASSARPVTSAFDVDQEVFALELEGKPLSTHPTEVFLPRAHHWRQGVTVYTTGGDTVRAGLNAAGDALEWWPDAAEERHLLLLAPRGAPLPESVPDFVQTQRAGLRVRLELGPSSTPSAPGG